MVENKEIYGVNTSFMDEGNGNDVLLLHGWGQNKEMMSLIYEHLKDRFHVWAIDFPGFGESEDPPVAWGVEDYELFLEDFISKNITPYSNTNITQERYRIELKKTIEYLKKIDNNIPIEIVAENIRLSAFCIGKIIGQIGTEEILDNIFSKFCIGK